MDDTDAANACCADANGANASIVPSGVPGGAAGSIARCGSAGRGVAEKASPRAAEALRGRLLAAIAAGAGLLHACGGRAQDVADEDADLGARQSAAGERGTGPSSPRANPDRSMQSSSPNGPEPPRRDGEICYSPSSISEVSGIGDLLQFLPADAIDDNGCLSSDYSGWLDGGGCNYDPRPAVVRGDRCCHLLDSSNPACGRPFVVAGAARTAPVRAGAAWLGGPSPRPAHGLEPELAREIGLEWLADARLEHASIAAFASFSLSLLALGAPAELLAQSQRAGLDEVEHARGAFALAARFTGETQEPAALSLAGVRLETELGPLMERTFLDGCVEETVAALVAAAQLDGARDAAVRAVLGRVAADEARHAELAWTFVAWALASGDPALKRRLLEARDRLEASGIGRAESTCPPEATSASALATTAQRRACGRLSAAELRELRASAWRDVIRPALDALLARGAEPRSPAHAAPASA